MRILEFHFLLHYSHCRYRDRLKFHLHFAWFLSYKCSLAALMCNDYYHRARTNDSLPMCALSLTVNDAFCLLIFSELLCYSKGKAASLSSNTFVLFHAKNNKGSYTLEFLCSRLNNKVSYTYVFTKEGGYLDLAIDNSNYTVR